MPSTITKVKFLGHHKLQLVGRLELPPQPYRALALFSHCFTCGKDILIASRLSRFLAHKGIATFRFDFAGLGESEGRFEDSNFSTNVEDLVCAALYLAQEHKMPDLLVGHSWGGTAALAAAARLKAIKAVVTINSPSNPVHVEKRVLHRRQDILEHGVAEVEVEGRSFTFKSHFLDDISSYNMELVYEQMRSPLLVMHAPDDSVVNPKEARAIFSAAHHPKSFISLPQADHMLSKEADVAYAASMICAWSETFLPSLPEPEEKPSVGKVRVQSIPGEKYQQQIHIGNFVLYADEPQALLAMKGPNPYEYLMAALGACTSMTLKMYAELKSIPLEKVIVILQHEKKHIESQDPHGKVQDEFRREITLEGNLTQEQRQALLKIAGKCPVHKTLQQSVIILDELK